MVSYTLSKMHNRTESKNSGHPRVLPCKRRKRQLAMQFWDELSFSLYNADTLQNSFNKKAQCSLGTYLTSQYCCLFLKVQTFLRVFYLVGWWYSFRLSFVLVGSRWYWLWCIGWLLWARACWMEVETASRDSKLLAYRIFAAESAKQKRTKKLKRTSNFCSCRESWTAILLLTDRMTKEFTLP